MLIDFLVGAVAIVTLIGVVAVRSLSSGRIEVKLNDAIVAAIVATLMLFVTGRISKLSVTSGGVEVERPVKEAFLSASAAPIENAVTSLPFQPINEFAKLGVSEIPNLIRRQAQSLDFILGKGGYEGDATKQYLESLTKYAFFRFVVLLNPDKTMFGIIDARELWATLNDQGSRIDFARFADLINKNDKEALKSLLQASSRRTPLSASKLLSEMYCRRWSSLGSTGCRFWLRMVLWRASSTARG